MKVGDRVLFRRADGKVCEDVIRSEVFDQVVMLEPYARNKVRPAVVLTNHSWTFVDDILEVLPHKEV